MKDHRIEMGERKVGRILRKLAIVMCVMLAVSLPSL